MLESKQNQTESAIFLTQQLPFRVDQTLLLPNGRAHFCDLHTHKKSETLLILFLDAALRRFTRQLGASGGSISFLDPLASPVEAAQSGRRRFFKLNFNGGFTN